MCRSPKYGLRSGSKLAHGARVSVRRQGGVVAPTVEASARATRTDRTRLAYRRSFRLVEYHGGGGKIGHAARRRRGARPRPPPGGPRPPARATRRRAPAGRWHGAAGGRDGHRLHRRPQHHPDARGARPHRRPVATDRGRDRHDRPRGRGRARAPARGEQPRPPASVADGGHVRPPSRARLRRRAPRGGAAGGRGSARAAVLQRRHRGGSGRLRARRARAPACGPRICGGRPGLAPPDPGLRDGNPRRVLVARSPARADPLSACWRGPRRPSCSTADSDVIRPRGVRFLDYEIELGLVLRREITSPTAVTDADLHDFVAGPVIVNDYSARDVQIPQTQFYKGKSFRTFGPVGPYLCMLGAGDMGALKDFRLTLTVNGEVRQSDSTRNLVYGPAETLTELSGVHDLHPATSSRPARRLAARWRSRRPRCSGSAGFCRTG